MFFLPPVTGGDVEEKAADQQVQTLAQEKLSSVSQPQGVRKGLRLMRTRGGQSHTELNVIVGLIDL